MYITIQLDVGCSMQPDYLVLGTPTTVVAYVLSYDHEDCDILEI